MGDCSIATGPAWLKARSPNLVFSAGFRYKRQLDRGLKVGLLHLYVQTSAVLCIQQRLYQWRSLFSDLDFRSRISDISSLISNFRSRISGFRSMISDIGSRISGFSFSDLGSRLKVTLLQHIASNYRVLSAFNLQPFIGM